MTQHDKNVAPALDPIEPTDKQVTNCHSLGWVYMGGGYFERGQKMGCFTVQGWVIT